MRPLFFAGLIVAVSACLQVGTPGDSGGGSASAGAAGSAAAGSSGVAAAGLQCGTDAASGISLCLGITSCPGVTVDSDQFPSCGYKINGSAIDLECLCGDSLCPMGLAASCADAKMLLGDQSALGVCAKVADGKCQVVKQTATGNTSGSCDKDCQSQCAGEPGCLSFCGC